MSKCVRMGLFLLTIAITVSITAHAGTWTRLKTLPPNYVSSPLLLTDGTVIVQEVHSGGAGTGIWYRLSPDNTGSYVNGTWSQIASMPSGYAPEYYASAVLPDGRALVEGGEYNGGTQDWTTLGAIYSPTANTWTSVGPPSGWSTIGDAPSVVLPNGTFMLSNCCSTQNAFFDAANLTWSVAPSGIIDDNESGLTLLPSNNSLQVSVDNAPASYLYNYSTEAWVSAGNTPSSLVALCEIGPAVLRADGTVIAFGATGATAVYSSSGVWTAGTPLPTGYVAQDVPAALLVSGSVLVAVSYPGTGTCSSPSYTQHTWFYEFNGSSYALVGGPSGNYPYENRFLALPDGNILWTHNSNDVEVYTPSSTVYQSAWQPTISSVASTLVIGSSNNVIQGKQFNGLSQDSMYGDDAQMATNYPMVRIKNNSTGHVFYTRTHGHSSMGVATGSATVSTDFDVSGSVESGTSQLYVVANGIPSAPVSVNITSTCGSPALSCTGVTAGCTVVKSSITLSCTLPTQISTSTQACDGSCATGNGASGVLTTSSASAGICGNSSAYCTYNWSIAGQNYSERLNAQVQ
jgi:hypothetical protein